MIEKIKPGDFMVTQGDTPIFSDVVGYYSNPCLANENENLWAINHERVIPEEFDPTHVMVIVHVDPSKQLGEKDAIVVVSADSNGVYCRSVRAEEWDQPWRIMGLLPGLELTAEQYERGRRFLGGTIGEGYDFVGCFADFPLNADLQNPHKWFCSEHTHIFFFFCGRLVVVRVKAAFVKPRDFYVSAIARTIASGPRFRPVEG